MCTGSGGALVIHHHPQSARQLLYNTHENTFRCSPLHAQLQRGVWTLAAGRQRETHQAQRHIVPGLQQVLGDNQQACMNACKVSIAMQRPSDETAEPLPNQVCTNQDTDAAEIAALVCLKCLQHESVLRSQA